MSNQPTGVMEPILIINTGSSSLKFGIYVKRGGNEYPLLDGTADGIGQDGGKFEMRGEGGRTLKSESVRFSSQSEALDYAAHRLTAASQIAPVAVGHRVVHGGPHLMAPQHITPEVIEELHVCTDFAPLHIPVALKLIAAAERVYPNIPQFACFDTAFHSTLPESAARFALSGDLFDEGIHRYGFHGLSYESIVHQLGEKLPARTVMAHLGSGASVVAIKGGRSVDTTMGLTPTGGIPMATRSGDLDPGVLLYLLRGKRMNVNSLEQLLNHNSGLIALSGGSGDMRELESAASTGDPKARLAIDVFCTAIGKAVASYACVLKGLDLLVFSGGIGEHSSLVRSRVCGSLTFLGISVDEHENQAHSPIISDRQSKVQVRIVPSQEDRVIARHCRALLHKS